MSIVDRALWVMERNSEQALSLNDIAAACGASRSHPCSPELASFECEPRSYAVFAHSDHVSTIFDTYAAIWDQALPAMARTVAESPVLEFHNDAFDPGTGLGGLQLYIPLMD